MGQPMQLEDVVLVQLGHPFRGHCHTGGHRMDLLGEPVHKDADGVVSLGLWERSNQVHADHLPGLRRDCMGIQWIVGALT